MTVPKFKRRPSGLDYVDNAFELQKDIMNLASKLSARWARIYTQPTDRMSCLQADLVNMAYSIQVTHYEDYITKRWLIMMSKAILTALERRVMDMVRVLYMNPVKCFSRKNGCCEGRAGDSGSCQRRRSELEKPLKPDEISLLLLADRAAGGRLAARIDMAAVQA